MTMKTKKQAWFSGLLLSTLTCVPAMAATSPAPGITAVEVQIGGIGPGVDARAFRQVKLLIAEGVYADTVAYFDVYGYGKEGGFSACLEKGTFAADGSFDKLVRALKAVKPDPRTTAYSVMPVERCTYPTAP
jgi:hypothetical protein